MLTIADIEAMTVPQIKKALKARGLSPTGKAKELVEHLIEECTEPSSMGLGDGLHEVVFKNKRGGGAPRNGDGVERDEELVLPPDLDVIDVEEMETVGELQAELKKRGLNEEGLFEELQFRLMEVVQKVEEDYELEMEGEFTKAQQALMDGNNEAAERSSGAVAGPGTGVQQSESDGASQLAQHPATNATGPGALGLEGEDVE